MLVLWSQLPEIFSCHKAALCFCMAESMLLLRAVSVLSVGFCLRVLSRCAMSLRISRGRREQVSFILPLGMWCLSAIRMALVRICVDV